MLAVRRFVTGCSNTAHRQQERQFALRARFLFLSLRPFTSFNPSSVPRLFFSAYSESYRGNPLLLRCCETSDSAMMEEEDGEEEKRRGCSLTLR